MPDPRDPTPVRAVQRGGKWTVVDAGGKQLPEAGLTDQAAAEALASRVNATWKRAKADRKAKGAPEVTEARARRVELFESILLRPAR